MPCAQKALLWLSFPLRGSHMPTPEFPIWRGEHTMLMQAKFNSYRNTHEDTTALANRKCALKTAEELVTDHGFENWGMALVMSRSIETL